VLWKMGGVGIDDGGEPRRSYTAYCSFEESVNVFKKEESVNVFKKEESVNVFKKRGECDCDPTPE
jgi:hypothetical protein